MRSPILALALLATLCACGSETPVPATAGSSPSPVAEEAPPAFEDPGVVEETAEYPAFTGTTVDGRPYDLAALRGRWVVVNFWATWCKPCLKEIPDLDAFDAEREDVTVIGLAYEEISPEDMKAFLAGLPSGAPRYAIAPLDVYDPPADFETPRGLPLSFLIDPEGRLAKKFLGPVTSQELAETIAATSGMAAGE